MLSQIKRLKAMFTPTVAPTKTKEELAEELRQAAIREAVAREIPEENL